MVAAWIVWTQLSGASDGANRKAQAVRSPSYGMWDVQETTISLPWRRIVVPYQGTAVIISTSEEAELFGTRIDVAARTIDFIRDTLSRTADPAVAYQFRYEQPTPDQLLLQSQTAGLVARVRLVRSAASPLMNHRHRWDW